MIKSETKLLTFALLLIAIITACVQLPEQPVSQDEGDASEAVSSSSPRLPSPPETQELSVDDAPETSGSEIVSEAVDDSIPHIAVTERVEVEDNAQVQTFDSASEVKADESVAASQEYVESLCLQIGNKLGSVSVDDCMRQNFHFGGGFSINERPLIIKDMLPAKREAERFKILLMGGIHGDEYSSISIIFKWLDLFSAQDVEGRFYWRIAPLVNPDGLLDGQAKRQNANGVDLNRNFPSLDWNDFATDYWQNKTGRNPRRFPGNSAASEPEVQWIIDQIETFNPDVIVSVHAPYHLLDFDGPTKAPEKIGELYLHQLGVYPGSLGNYAGVDKGIPVVTLELPSAGIMPSREQIQLMWLDLVAWLQSADQETLAN